MGFGTKPLNSIRDQELPKKKEDVMCGPVLTYGYLERANEEDMEQCRNPGPGLLTPSRPAHLCAPTAAPPPPTTKKCGRCQDAK